MRFKRAYIKWLVLLLMNIAISGNADEMTYDSKELGQNIFETPRNVKAVQVGKSEVLVTWDVPESRGKQHLTNRVFYAPVEDGDKWETFDVSGSTATIIGNFSQGETYTIRVSSVSPLGQGPMSLPVTVTIRHLGEYLISLDVRQIGSQNVFIQWDKLNLTDIELESVKRVVLNHKIPGSPTVDAYDVPDWKTRTHYLLQDVNMNSKHTFQLLVLFELQSQSPIISKPVEFELVPRAPDESMLHLTADMELYDLKEKIVEGYHYGYRHTTRTEECTRMSEKETILSTRQYDEIATAKKKCYINSNQVMVTEIKFFNNGNMRRSFVVADNKTLAWIMAHF